MSMRSLDEVVGSLVILTLLGFLALLLLWYGYNGLAAIFELLTIFPNPKNRSGLGVLGALPIEDLYIVVGIGTPIILLDRFPALSPEVNRAQPIECPSSLVDNPEKLIEIKLPKQRAELGVLNYTHHAQRHHPAQGIGHKQRLGVQI